MYLLTYIYLLVQLSPARNRILYYHNLKMYLPKSNFCVVANSSLNKLQKYCTDSILKPSKLACFSNLISVFPLKSINSHLVERKRFDVSNKQNKSWFQRPLFILVSEFVEI